MTTLREATRTVVRKALRDINPVPDVTYQTQLLSLRGAWVVRCTAIGDDEHASQQRRYGHVQRYAVCSRQNVAAHQNRRYG